MNNVKRPRSASVGLKDRTLEGWFNRETGELATGVPVRASDTVIDVGCGDGGVIGFCASQGAEVIFIDRDKVRLERTEARVAESAARSYRGILSDCDPIPVADATGDLVICTEVLEHVPDPAMFLAELVRITKPGSKLLLTVPDSRSEELVAATAPVEYFQEPNHIRVFSVDDFKSLVLNADLEIESHQFLGCFWSIFWPLSWMTCKPGGGLPIDNDDPIVENWVSLWAHLQRHPDGEKIRNALNQLLPKSQSIVARKPM
ncbi:MAG: class I SAM-dependent methyltransferase [Pseudomonadota bacterium]